MKNRLNILVLLIIIGFFVLSGCKNKPNEAGHNSSDSIVETVAQPTGKPGREKVPNNQTDPASKETKEGNNQEKEESLEVVSKTTQECSCSGKKVAIDPSIFMGNTFPMISDTNPPSYFEISTEDPIGTFVPGEKVNESLTEDVFELNKDMTISTNQDCDVGIYTASYTEEIRQNVQVCGNQGGGSCTMLDIEQTMINASMLSKRKDYNACTWSDLKKNHWKMYAFNPDGQFSHVDGSKTFGMLDIHFDKGSASLSLRHIDPSIETISFDNIQAEAPLKVQKDNVTVTLHTHTVDGQKTTHILGSIQIDDKEYVLVGLPILKFVHPMGSSFFRGQK